MHSPSGNKNRRLRGARLFGSQSPLCFEGTVYTRSNDSPVVWRALPFPPLSVRQRVIDVAADANGWAQFILTSNGDLFAIGGNYSGMLGQGSSRAELASSDVPLLVPMPGPVDKVVVGLEFAFARICGHQQQPCQWLGWGDNSDAQLPLLARTRHYSPVPLPRLDGVVDVWCGQCASFAVMRHESAKEPVLCGWGNCPRRVFGYPIDTFGTEPAPIPGFESWATAKGLHVIRVVSNFFHHLCLLGDSSGHRSVVMGWGWNTSHEISDDTDHIYSPVPIHDSATAPRLANGKPCVIVDAFCGTNCTFLMTCEGGVLVRGRDVQGSLGTGFRDCRVTSLTPVIGIPARGLDAALVVEDGLVAIDRDGRLLATPGAGCCPLTGDDGTKGAVGLIPVPADRLPSRAPAKVATHALCNAGEEMEGWLECWLVARQRMAAEDDSALGSMPRDVARLVADWIRTPHLTVIADTTPAADKEPIPVKAKKAPPVQGTKRSAACLRSAD